MTRTGITFNTTIKPRTIKAVVFDLDDTLYPYRQYVLSGYHAIAEYIRTIYSVDVEKELVERYMQGEQHALENALHARFKHVEDTLLQKMTYVYMSHTPDIELYPDARVSMALVIARGKKVGVLLDGPLGMQRNKMAALGLEPLVDSMIYADELIGGEACRQPCQDPFFIMSLQMETELEEMVFVGDNPLVDFVAPRQLGMMTVRVQRPDGSHLSDEPPNPAYAPDIVIPSLFELADVLQEIECPLI